MELARIYNVHPNTIGKLRASPMTKWKAELMEKGATVFSNDTQGQPVRASL